MQSDCNGDWNRAYARLNIARKMKHLLILLSVGTCIILYGRTSILRKIQRCAYLDMVSSEALFHKLATGYSVDTIHRQASLGERSESSMPRTSST